MKAFFGLKQWLALLYILYGKQDILDSVRQILPMVKLFKYTVAHLYVYITVTDLLAGLCSYGIFD